MFTNLPEKMGPLKRTVPSPLTMLSASRVCAQSLKFRVPGADAVKVPLLVPPPPNPRVPMGTVTRPLLLKTASIWVTPVPTDLVKVPLLLKLPPFKTVMVWSFWASKLPPLLKTPPPRIRRSPLPVQIAAPELCRVRGQISFKSGPSMLRPPLALVRPSPDMIPPAKVVSPLKFNVPVPPKKPPLRVKSLLISDRLSIERVPPDNTIFSSLSRL